MKQYVILPTSSFFLVSEILFPRNLLTSKIYPSLSPLVLSLTRIPTPLQLMINKMSVVARLRWSFSGWEIDDLSPMLIQVRGYGATVIHMSGRFANSHSTFMIVMTENGPERYLILQSAWIARCKSSAWNLTYSLHFAMLGDVLKLLHTLLSCFKHT